MPATDLRRGTGAGGGDGWWVVPSLHAALRHATPRHATPRRAAPPGSPASSHAAIEPRRAPPRSLARIVACGLSAYPWIDGRQDGRTAGRQDGRTAGRQRHGTPPGFLLACADAAGLPARLRGRGGAGVRARTLAPIRAPRPSRPMTTTTAPRPRYHDHNQKRSHFADAITLQMQLCCVIP
jgi:hypothetical protein